MDGIVITIRRKEKKKEKIELKDSD